MINLLLMDKKTYKESKESCWFRIVWEKEQYKKHWRKMRLLRIKNKIEICEDIRLRCKNAKTKLDKRIWFNLLVINLPYNSYKVVKL